VLRLRRPAAGAAGGRAARADRRRRLYPFYSELAERFAQAGYHAIAIDYFGRTAGLGPRDAEFEYMPHVQRLTVAVIGFYGVLIDRFGVDGPLERVGDMRAPVLGLFGGADQGIPVEQVEEFDERLTKAGLDHEIHVYPGAPHSFFDRRFEEYADACDNAWRRMPGFLERHTG
jgi:carboxymethylenebutenolidase